MANGNGSNVELSVDVYVDSDGITRFGCRATRRFVGDTEWIAGFSRGDDLVYDQLRAEVVEMLDRGPAS